MRFEWVSEALREPLGGFSDGLSDPFRLEFGCQVGFISDPFRGIVELTLVLLFILEPHPGSQKGYPKRNIV